MGLKEYLRPNFKKILITILLIVISGILVFIAFFPFYFATNLFRTVPYSMIITILVCYPFACYISQSGYWFRGIVIFIFAFGVFSLALGLIISFYNDMFSYSCNTDSDCKWSCGHGAYNDRYISTKYPYGFIDCWDFYFAICENNRCQSFDVNDAVSIEDCERASDEYTRSGCYFALAEKLNDSGICNQIKDRDSQFRCISKFR